MKETRKISGMSKSSKQIAINFPNELLAIFEECLRKRHFRDFVREAVAEKLRRDFGKRVPAEFVNRKLGERVDLRNPSPETRRKMEKQAARARAGRNASRTKKKSDSER